MCYNTLMDEKSRYAVGLDVGTENVRAVVGLVGHDNISVVGYGELANAGMRKGVVANLIGPAEAIDKMLGEVERMSGYEVNSAFVSVNGSHLLSTKAEGMIAMGEPEHEITLSDLQRIEDAALTGRIPPNRDVLDLVPIEYKLDGQGGIKDPLGMTGSRLELRANVISGMTPTCDSLQKATENAKVRAERLVPTAAAAGRAVLTDRQKESGVAVVDLGAATTSLAIFEEGELQYVASVPVGANNITNDLAIMLEIDTNLAENLKRKFASGADLAEEILAKPVALKSQREEYVFDRAKIDEVVKARLAEIFAQVMKKIKEAGYEKRLPEGITLTGGGAKLKDIDYFAKHALGASVRLGAPHGLGGVADAVQKPEFAVAVGLMLLAAESEESAIASAKKAGSGQKLSWIKKLFGKI